MLCNLYLVSLFIPLEFNVIVSGVRLEPYRVLLIIFFIKYLAINEKIKAYFFLNLFVLFVFISLVVNHDVLMAIKTSGILYLETCVSFMVGVMYVKSEKQFEKKMFFLSGLYFLTIVPSLIEFYTGHKVVHDFFQKITGKYELSPELYGPSYMRFGFTRTVSVFSHPILYGVSASFIIPLIMSLQTMTTKSKVNFFVTRVIGLWVAIITSLTSAALSVILLQVIIKYWYKRIVKNISVKRLIIMMFIFFLLVIQFGSNRGLIKFLAMSIALNPHTAYYRLLQWEFAWDDVLENFFFGIGYRAFTHPDWFSPSIDSYWLLNILQYGIFSFIFLVVFYFIYFRETKLLNSYNQNKFGYILGFRLLVVSVIYVGFTVDFFDRLQPLMYFLLGSGVWLFDKKQEKT